MLIVLTNNLYIKSFLIVAAGPVFNLILAVIFFTIVHFSGITGMKPFVTSIEGHNLSQVKNKSFHEIIESKWCYDSKMAGC